MASFFRSSFLCGCALLFATGTVYAQSYPSKPVNLTVPYPPGGASDVIARIFSEPLGKALGQHVIVENLGGANGAIAAQKVLAAPADGQVVFQGSPNELILSPLINSAVKFKAEDFRLVHPVVDGVMVFVARKDLPANSVDELIALARKSPDKPLIYGSTGVGSLYHLIPEKIQQDTGVKLLHAPYKGGIQILQDIAGGQVDFAITIYSSVMGGMVDQGRLKIIGQLGAQRSELLKDVPLASEGQDMKNISYKMWTGFFVRRNTPEDVVQKLHQAISTTLKSPAVREQLTAQTLPPAPPTSLAEAAKFYEAETTRYRGIARSINLQPQ